MRPIKQAQRLPDQNFDSTERLYRRVPPSCIGLDDDVEASCIRCSFGKEIESSPSVVRAKYGTIRDTLSRLCADGKDVSSEVVFWISVKSLPNGVLSGANVPHDFYPFHAPLSDCFAHTVIACRQADSPPGAYKEPSRPVKNEFRAKFAAALERAEIPSLPVAVLQSLKRRWALRRIR